MGEAVPNCGVNPLYECIIKVERDLSCLHVRLLSLRRPGLLVLSCVDFVEAIQDPRQLFTVKQPESQMDQMKALGTSFTRISCFAEYVYHPAFGMACFAGRQRHGIPRASGQIGYDETPKRFKSM